jgi:hypothetical protein
MTRANIEAACETIAGALLDWHGCFPDTDGLLSEALGSIVEILLADLDDARVLGALATRFWEKGKLTFEDYEAVVSEIEAEVARRVEGITRDGVCPDCGKRAASIAHVCATERRAS